jgi:hypothetical protein
LVARHVRELTHVVRAEPVGAVADRRGDADHRRERSAQLMGDHRQELVLDPVQLGERLDGVLGL